MNAFGKILFRMRTLGMGLAAASAAFSWALCTTSTPDSRSVAVQPRVVGSGLHLSNPFIGAGITPQFPTGGNTALDPKGFDLGDATVGSSLSRYINALDGVTPYIFTSTTAGTLGLAVSSTGHVTGTTTITGTNANSFSATVLDATGLTRSGLYFLRPAAATLHFAVDAIPQGAVGQDYNTTIEVLGGDTTSTVFSVVSGSVQINGVASPDLETAGLRLFNDGTLAGRPLVSGTVRFTAQAIKSGTHALNRAQTGTDQTFTLNIEALSSVQSVLATQSATISIGGRLRDTFSFKGFLNADGLSNSAFAGKNITIRLGSQTFKTTLDARGRSPRGNINVTLNAPRALLRLQIRNADFSKLFDAFPTGFTQTAILQVGLGDDYLGTEAIGFTVRSRGSRAQLQYTLGRTIQLGGLFEIYSVKAADFGSNSTAFKIGFLISHVRGNTSQTFGTPQAATVNIGQGFTQTVSLNRGRARGFSPGLRSVAIDTNRKFGSVQTFALPSSQTGVLPASNGKAQTLLLGINLTTSTLQYKGEGSAVLVPFTGFR